jgi:hypothetical protein
MLRGRHKFIYLMKKSGLKMAMNKSGCSTLSGVIIVYALRHTGTAANAPVQGAGNGV